MLDKDKSAYQAQLTLTNEELMVIAKLLGKLPEINRIFAVGSITVSSPELIGQAKQLHGLLMEGLTILGNIKPVPKDEAENAPYPMSSKIQKFQIFKTKVTSLDVAHSLEEGTEFSKEEAKYILDQVSVYSVKRVQLVAIVPGKKYKIHIFGYDNKYHFLKSISFSSKSALSA